MNAENPGPLGIWADPFHPDGTPPSPLLWNHEARPWQPQLPTYYLERYSLPGDLVVDPFASQTALVDPACRGQRRLLLSHFSPATIAGLMATIRAPSPTLLDATFSRIADAPRRGRTLADFLQSLYEVICPECAQTITASYYVWDRDSGEPVEKGYNCPHCQGRGRAPTDMADMQLAAGLEVRGAAYWGLLSRLVAPGDALTGKARDLLDLYTPRSLLAISELLAAVEQRLLQEDSQQVGRALVLHVLQRCASLHSPSQTPESALEAQAAGQPLRPEAHFVEPNAWMAFEQAYHSLRQRAVSAGASTHAPPTLSSLSNLLGAHGNGGVLILSHTVQELAERLEPGSVSLILSDPLRPNPADYVLGFLWSGWLFGRQAAERLRVMLELPNMTWDWYARAMTVALRSLGSLLKPDGHMVLAFSAPSTRLPLALLAAASQAGLQLVGQSTQIPLTSQDGQPGWRLVLAPGTRKRSAVHPGLLAEALRQEAQVAAQNLVTARAEPVPLPLVHTACAVRWETEGLLAQLPVNREEELGGRRPISFLAQQARSALSPQLPPAGLRLFRSGTDKSPPQWAPEALLDEPPLSDRVERAVVELLALTQPSEKDLAAQIYARFRGWLTPDAALVAACVASYGQQMEGGGVQLRSEDWPAARARERGEMLLRLHELGHRLHYEVWVAPWEQDAALGLVPLGHGGPGQAQEWAPAGLVWHEGGRPVHAFALTLDASLGPWLAPPPQALASCPHTVVLPGGRAGLLAFKLERCPAWRVVMAEGGWEFVKYRHLRQLSAVPSLSLAGFRARIGLDPVVTQASQQLTLFTTLPERESPIHAH